MNPAPDMDIYSLKPAFFEWVLNGMVDLTIRLARSRRRQVKQIGWADLFAGSRRK
jgi:hypothetical protein